MTALTLSALAPDSVRLSWVRRDGAGPGLAANRQTPLTMSAGLSAIVCHEGAG